MKRRGFLGLLASVAAAAVLDPEKLLWVPGAKTISIPAPLEHVWLYHPQYRAFFSTIEFTIELQRDHNRALSMSLEQFERSLKTLRIPGAVRSL